jgi:hypothetical protein
VASASPGAAARGEHLERLVGGVVTASEKRLFDTLLGLITADQARLLLLGLLDVSAGDRVSPLERAAVTKIVVDKFWYCQPLCPLVV